MSWTTIDSPAGPVRIIAEDGTDSDLVPVYASGHPQSGALADQRGHPGVLGQLVVDRDRVAVRIEQPPAAFHRRAHVAEVLDNQAAAHEGGPRGVVRLGHRESNPSGAVRK